MAGEWLAPVARNHVECAWLLLRRPHRPGRCRDVLGTIPDASLFAMEYLPPRPPAVEGRALAGRVDPVLAGQVGDVIGLIPAVSAADPRVPEAFATDDNFAALRIEPYFHVTARRNPAWRTACVSSPNDRVDPGRAGPRRRQPEEHPGPAHGR